VNAFIHDILANALVHPFESQDAESIQVIIDYGDQMMAGEIDVPTAAGQMAEEINAILAGSNGVGLERPLNKGSARDGGARLLPSPSSGFDTRQNADR